MDVSELLRDTKIFASVPLEGLRHIAAATQLREFGPSASLMNQGDKAEAMYLVVEGKVRVERSEDGGKSHVVLAELGAGTVVGEMGVLDRLPRSATVTAIGEVQAVEISGCVLTEVMVHHPEVSEALRHIVSERLRDTDALIARMFADLLRKVAIFAPVSDDAVATLAQLGRRRTFSTGDILMRQGEASNSMHVISRGDVRIERAHCDLQGTIVLDQLGEGDIVGEMGVLDGEARSATVVALNEVETMELDATRLGDAMIQFPELATILLHVVTRRMRTTDALLSELLAKRTLHQRRGLSPTLRRGRQTPTAQ